MKNHWRIEITKDTGASGWWWHIWESCGHEEEPWPYESGHAPTKTSAFRRGMRALKRATRERVIVDAG